MQIFSINWIDVKRIIRSGVTNFRRNGVVSAASMLVMTITLCVIMGLILLNATMTHALQQLEDKIDITIYFTLSAEESSILSFQEQIEQLPEVAYSEYISQEAALENFRERHEDDYLTLQALDELDQNPLGAMLLVKAHDPAQYESVATFLEEQQALENNAVQIIDKVNYHQNEIIIDRIATLLSGGQQLGLAITIVLALIAIAVTFNTIRLTIYISREEIRVMRLVGADNKYIRGPFMIEGFLYGTISAVLAILLFFPVTLWLGNTMTSFFGLNLFNYYVTNFVQLAIILLLSGGLIGVIASLFAIRRYLIK